MKRHSMKPCDFAMRVLIAMVLGVACVFGAERTWIGTGECEWSDAANWKDGVVPAGGYVDSVVFANASPAIITQSAGVWVTDVKVIGADVTLKGSYFKLSGGTIDVAEGSSLTFSELLQGKEHTFPLVKTGGGDMHVYEKCTTFAGFEARGGRTYFYKPGDAVNVTPTVTVFEGASVIWGGKNIFENTTVFDVKKGGVLDLAGYPDTIGAICGDGIVTNSTSSVCSIVCTMPYGPYMLDNTFCGEGSVSFSFTPNAKGDAADAYYLIGKEDVCRNVQFTIAEKSGYPLPIKFASGIGAFSVKGIHFNGLPEFEFKDTSGAPVRIADATVRVQSGVTSVLSGGGTDVEYTAVNSGSVMSVAGGVSTNCKYNASSADATLEFADGVAFAPVFNKSAYGANLVLSGGRTVDGTWSSAGGAEPSYITVSGGVHTVTNVFFAYNQCCIRQTGGYLEFTRGINAFLGVHYCNSALMMLSLEGGTFVLRSPGGTGYSNRGTGLDASGNAKVWLYDESGHSSIRVSSDGDSHLIRIRDNAEVNWMNNAVLMCNGSEGDSATGTVDIVSGTLAMRCPFTSPGTLADFPTFLLFNGGLLKFTELNGDIVNPHGDAHHVYVGASPARILVDTSVTDRTVRFDTPFKANPANDGIDGGIEKDGAGTLKLNAPAEIYGPVKVKAGILASGGADGATPAFGSGSLYLSSSAVNPQNYAGTTLFATGSGSKLVYEGSSFLFFPSTSNGGTYVFGDSSAESSSFSQADESSFLVIRNGTLNSGIGESFKVKVNGGMGVIDGMVDQPVFSTTSDSANTVGLFSFLSYNTDNGFVPSSMTAFDSAGESDLADVTSDAVLSGEKSVRALRLHMANLTLNDGAVLTVGDGTHYAAVLFNNNLDGVQSSLSGSGTLSFGSSRGFLVNGCPKYSEYNTVSTVIAGENGVVFGGSPEYRSWFVLSGANTYSGGTWIEGTRVTPSGGASVFGSSADVYVKGNSAWGGQLYFTSQSASDFGYNLHLEGRGVNFDSETLGALVAEQSMTVSGDVELMGDTRICALGSKVSLNLSGEISGVGRMETWGEGRICLAASNPDWTGGVSVTDASLVVSVQDALGSGDVEVCANGTLLFENATDIVVTNRIVGVGKIVLKGASVTFTALDDFEGDIDVRYGSTLNAEGNPLQCDISGDGVISGSGTLVFDVPEGERHSFAGSVTGDVSIMKTGEGILYLSGASDCGNSVTVEAGRLALGGTAFLENVMSDAVVHLDASDESTIKYDSDGNVSKWSDVDGRAITFTNMTASTQPKFVKDAINGLAALRFNKGLAHLVSDSTIANRTIFMVHRNATGSRPSDMSSAWKFAGIYGRNGEDKGVRFFEQNTWDWEGWGSVFIQSIACNGAVYDGAASGSALFIAGRITVSMLELGVLEGGKLCAVGDYWHHSTLKRSYFGDIGELIVFSRTLSSAERQVVQDALIKKWGGAYEPTVTPYERVIRDAVAHFDASAVGSVDLDSDGRVSEWRDADGRDIAMTNSLPSASPSYQAETMGGRAALRFDAFGHHLASTANLDNRTVVLVHRNKSGARPSSMNGNWSCAGIWGENGADKGIRFSALNKFDTVGWGKDTCVSRVNGVDTTAVTADAVSVSVIELETLHGGIKCAVGDYWHSSTYKRSYYGDIGEVIVFSRTLEADEIAVLEEGLMKKWGLLESDEDVEDEEIIETSPTISLAAGSVLEIGVTNLALTALNGMGSVEASVNTVLSLSGASSFGGCFYGGIELFLGEGATLDLMGGLGKASVSAVSGFGRIYDGSLAVTDEIKPGGSGVVGTLVFESAPIVAGASLESEMIAGEGDLLKVEGAFDISGLSLDVPSFTEFPEYSVKVIEASERTGALMSDNFSNHTELFVVSYATDGVWIKRNNGSMVIIK